MRESAVQPLAALPGLRCWCQEKLGGRACPGTKRTGWRCSPALWGGLCREIAQQGPIDGRKPAAFDQMLMQHVLRMDANRRLRSSPCPLLPSVYPGITHSLLSYQQGNIPPWHLNTCHVNIRLTHPRGNGPTRWRWRPRSRTCSGPASASSHCKKKRKVNDFFQIQIEHFYERVSRSAIMAPRSGGIRPLSERPHLNGLSAAFLIPLWLQQRSCMGTIDKEPMFPAADLRRTGSDHKTWARKVINCPILSDLILLFSQCAHYSSMFRF